MMRIIRIVPFLASAALIAMPAMAEMHGKQHGPDDNGHRKGAHMEMDGKNHKPHGKRHGGKGKGPHIMIQKADKDGDGEVSRAEFMDFHESKFKQIDRDDDGIISRDEMMKKRSKMRQKRKHIMQDKQAE